MSALLIRATAYLPVKLTVTADPSFRSSKEKTATDQIYNTAYTKKDKDITGMKRELSDLQQSWKSPRIDEEYSDIDGYLDNKMVHNAQITNQIKSVLNSLDDHINSQPRVISESQNTSGDDKNET